MLNVKTEENVLDLQVRLKAGAKDDPRFLRSDKGHEEKGSGASTDSAGVDHAHLPQVESATTEQELQAGEVAADAAPPPVITSPKPSQRPLAGPGPGAYLSGPGY